MPYTFRRVDIKVFDFHLALDPVVAPASLNPGVEFLSDSTKYNQQFEAKPFTAGAFRVRPLRKKTRTYHHFWKYYTSAFGQFDPWSMLVPFICEPTQHKLEITAPRKGIRVFARPAIYLFSFGWSTVIEISLQGQAITVAELRDFMRDLRTSSGTPFLLDGVATGLSGALRKYGEELKKVVFKKGLGAADLRRIDRQFVVSLSQFDGDISYYKPQSSNDHPMEADDKAGFHQILLGNDIPAVKVVAPEANPNVKADFLLTRLSGAGFAITYFDIGTLFFVQNKAKNKVYETVMNCLGTNIMSCMMMLLSLQNFYDFPDTKKATAKSVLAEVRDSARERILELPQRYKNAVIMTWCKFYTPVQKILAAADADNGARH
jgi:hypothetical protein